MDFYEEIASRGFTSFIRSIPYKAPTYHGWEKVKSFLLDLVYNKKTVYIEGDYENVIGLPFYRIEDKIKPYI